jgi:hypothetical protein
VVIADYPSDSDCPFADYPNNVYFHCFWFCCYLTRSSLLVSIIITSDFSFPPVDTGRIDLQETVISEGEQKEET